MVSVGSRLSLNSAYFYHLTWFPFFFFFSFLWQDQKTNKDAGFPLFLWELKKKKKSFQIRYVLYIYFLCFSHIFLSVTPLCRFYRPFIKQFSSVLWFSWRFITRPVVFLISKYISLQTIFFFSCQIVSDNKINLLEEGSWNGQRRTLKALFSSFKWRLIIIVFFFKSCILLILCLSLSPGTFFSCCSP